MHLGNQPQSLLVIVTICEVHLRCKDCTGIIRIGIHGKRGKRQQVNAIPVFQCRQISVTHRHTDHIGNTGVITRRCSHPKNVMVSPLDIEVMIIAECIHNDMRSRTTVVNISYDVQGINRQPLDKITHRDDEII